MMVLRLYLGHVLNMVLNARNFDIDRSDPLFGAASFHRFLPAISQERVMIHFQIGMQGCHLFFILIIYLDFAQFFVQGVLIF